MDALSGNGFIVKVFPLPEDKSRESLLITISEANSSSNTIFVQRKLSHKHFLTCGIENVTIENNSTLFIFVKYYFVIDVQTSSRWSTNRNQCICISRHGVMRNKLAYQRKIILSQRLFATTKKEKKILSVLIIIYVLGVKDKRKHWCYISMLEQYISDWHVHIYLMNHLRTYVTSLIKLHYLVIRMCQ